LPAASIISDSLGQAWDEDRKKRYAAGNPFDLLSARQKLVLFVPALQCLIDSDRTAPLITWKTQGPVLLLISEVKVNLFTDCDLDTPGDWRAKLRRCRVPGAPSLSARSTHYEAWCEYADFLGSSLLSDAPEDLGGDDVLEFPASEPSDIEAETLWARLDAILEPYN